MAKAQNTPTLPLVVGSGRIPAVEERYSPELVIAFVGPVGSGVSTAAKIAHERLESNFGYNGKIIKVSDIINDHASLMDEPPSVRGSTGWTEVLQRIGTKIRSKHGGSYIADLVVNKISMTRDDGDPNPRKFTIIDSIKHPDEVAKLQHVYGQAFWLVGVFAPTDKRKERLAANFSSDSEISKIMETDEDEKGGSGQKVRDTIFLSDYFIRNDGDNDEYLKSSVHRLFDVIFGIGVQTPTRDESAMYAAASAAARGACLSRQVGAVIVNKSGEIIGTGTNDVPKFGGGLYTYEDGRADARCYKWKGKACHNDRHKLDLKKKIISSLIAKGIVRADKSSDAEEIIFSSGIKQLIEFSRAVHAEMEAIISVARSGGQGLRGSTLYSTTYPCHSCARHIVVAGIEKVVYIEPYAKSLALELHSDAISTKPTDRKGVSFVQYEGMAPKNLLKVFKNDLARKGAGGSALIRSPGKADPILREHVDDFQRREKMVAGALANVQKPAVVAGGENAANE